MPEVNVRRIGSNYNLRVYNAKKSIFHEEASLILLDGVPIEEATNIIKFDPLKIHNIAVSTSSFIAGSRKYEGIISFKSYTGNQASNLEQTEFTIKTPYIGFHALRKFYSPEYSASNSKLLHAPDYRNSVYWKVYNNKIPSTTTYYNPDLTGDYSVWVEGFDQNGGVIWSEYRYTITP